MISATRFIYTAILTIGFMLLSIMSNHAQNLTLIQATSQRWAGGVCCRHGEIYTIHLKVDNQQNNLELDSISINGYNFSLEKYNVKNSSLENSDIISIRENIVFNEGTTDNMNHFDSEKKEVVLSYYINKKKKTLDISGLIEELGFLAYP